MGNWIDSVLERLKALWPFKRIPPWERAIRISYWPWLKEPKVEVLAPGMRGEFWFMQEVIQDSVVQQVKQLPTQSVTTSDGVAVTFDGTITYDVVDLEAKLTKVHDFEHSLQNLAMMHLSASIRKVEWDFLQHHQRGLERTLRRSLAGQVAPWGVRVLKVGITGLVRSRQYRVYGDPMPYFHG